jgi:hypothetical protein
LLSTFPTQHCRRGLLQYLSPSQALACVASRPMLGAAGRALALLLSAAVLAPSLVRAGAPSCLLHVGKDDYDLSGLSVVKTFESERNTPPTVTIDRVRMLLCGGDDAAGLPHEDGYEPADEVRHGCGSSNRLLCSMMLN